MRLNPRTFDRGCEPRSFISSLKESSCRKFFSSFIRETKVPFPRWLNASPRLHRDLSACPAVIRLTPSRAAISCSDGICSPGSVRRNGFVPSSPAESGSTAAPRFAGQEPLRPPSRTVVWTTGHIYIPEFPVNRNFHFDAKGWPRRAFASFQSRMTVSGETLNNPTFSLDRLGPSWSRPEHSGRIVGKQEVIGVSSG